MSTVIDTLNWPPSALAAIDAQRAEIERLRRLLVDVPVLIINERNARVLGEKEALGYMQALREWHPKVQEALALPPQQAQGDPK